MYSCGPPHMAKQKQDDQLEHTYSSYVMIRDVTLKTCTDKSINICQRRWMIGRRQVWERGSRTRRRSEISTCWPLLTWWWNFINGLVPSRRWTMFYFFYGGWLITKVWIYGKKYKKGEVKHPTTPQETEVFYVISTLLGYLMPNPVYMYMINI